MRCEGVLEPFLARSPPLRPHPRGHAPAAGVSPVHVPGVLMSAFQQARSARVSPLLRELSLRRSSGETFALASATWAPGEDLGGRQFIWECSCAKHPQTTAARPPRRENEVRRGRGARPGSQSRRGGVKGTGEGSGRPGFAPRGRTGSMLLPGSGPRYPHLQGGQPDKGASPRVGRSVWYQLITISLKKSQQSPELCGHEPSCMVRTDSEWLGGGRRRGGSCFWLHGGR